MSRGIVENIRPDGSEIQHLIQLLVAKHVAITSTLAVLEPGTQPVLETNPRLKALMHPRHRETATRVKAGVGYDSEAIYRSLQGQIGMH